MFKRKDRLSVPSSNGEVQRKVCGGVSLLEPNVEGERKAIMRHCQLGAHEASAETYSKMIVGCLARWNMALNSVSKLMGVLVYSIGVPLERRTW